MDILIVGAGIAGLMAAHQLREKGLSVALVDKGRNIGGRLATRRLGPGQADTGAQFITAHSEPFRSQVLAWEVAGLVYEWGHGWADPAGQSAPDGYPRYAARGGMSALAKELARDLFVQLNIKIAAVSPVQEGWQVTDVDGRIFTSRALLLTAPVPQSLTFVEMGRTPMKLGDLEALRQIEYTPCLAGVFRLDRPTQLPEPGGLPHASALIDWAADNLRKGISPEPTLTVHANPVFSREAYQQPESEVLARLLADLRAWLGAAEVQESWLKRWRYARPARSHPAPYLVAEGVPPLAFAGDAFGEPRVEGAALSGLAAAKALGALLAAA